LEVIGRGPKMRYYRGIFQEGLKTITKKKTVIKPVFRPITSRTQVKTVTATTTFSVISTLFGKSSPTHI
jgi:hypothetical protein